MECNIDHGFTVDINKICIVSELDLVFTFKNYGNTLTIYT